MYYFLCFLGILFGLFGCASEESQRKQDSSEKKSSNAFDWNDKGQIEKENSEKKGYTYQPAEYSTEDFQPATENAEKKETSEQNTKPEKLILKEEFQSVKAS
ncbi:MAG: hypothetical protein AABZ60_01965, partial [Planctomycetota bacterium]